MTTDNLFREFPRPWKMHKDKDNSGPFMYDAHNKLVDIRVAGHHIVELINQNEVAFND